MNRTLITGGAGFIGSHIIRRLLAETRQDIVVLDDMTTGQRSNLPDSPRLEFIEGSIVDIAEYPRATENVDTIIHLAALISSQDSLHSPDEYLDVNVRGLLRVVEATSAQKPHVVFASSSTVYGSRADAALSEATLPEPITTYALTKLAGEHLLAMYAPLLGFTHVSLRLFNVFGPRQNPDHPYANVACKFARAAAQGVGVDLYGDGKQTRDFVYIDDVVSAFVAVSTPGNRHAVYNVGTGIESSVAQLLGMAQQEAATPIAVNQRGEWPNDIRRIAAEASRIREEVDWKPKTSLRDGFARTVQFFRPTQFPPASPQATSRAALRFR